MALLLPALLLAAADPVEGADLIDAIECRLTIREYTALSLALDGKDGVIARQGWKKVEGSNPFLLEYDLPFPITVAGSYTTRRIAFTAEGILAVLDQPDPAVIARAAQVENAFTGALSITRPGFHKFMGERILSQDTTPLDDGWSRRTTIALNVSNVDTDPDKTLYGCSYRMDILDKNGKRF